MLPWPSDLADVLCFGFDRPDLAALRAAADDGSAPLRPDGVTLDWAGRAYRVVVRTATVVAVERRPALDPVA